ncbi:MAG: HTTM domain-containing protein [Gemmataceae bacterium]|nr:HTTM domain-containing protein [Gemmataceae bacterium]
MQPLNALTQLAAEAIDPRPVAALRVVVGLNTILCGVESWLNLERILRPEALRLPFAVGLPALPDSWLPAFMAVWMLLAACLIAGCWTRAAAVALACQLGYVLLLDAQSYSNHLYLLTLEIVFLALGNAGAIWSVDAWRRGPATCPAWPMTLWKWQISIVYFFAAAAKLNPTFLSGQMLANFWPTTGWLDFLAGLRTPAVLQPVAVAAVATEFFLAAALWLPAFRRLAVVVGVGLHLGMGLLVSQKDPTGIIVFALATVPPYVLFFDWERTGSGPRQTSARRAD